MYSTYKDFRHILCSALFYVERSSKTACRRLVYRLTQTRFDANRRLEISVSCGTVIMQSCLKSFSQPQNWLTPELQSSARVQTSDSSDLSMTDEALKPLPVDVQAVEVFVQFPSVRGAWPAHKALNTPLKFLSILLSARELFSILLS